MLCAMPSITIDSIGVCIGESIYICVFVRVYECKFT